MIQKFDFRRPQSLQEALTIMAEYGSRARILAGGTDILPGFHQGSRRFENIDLLVDLNAIPVMKTISEESGQIAIGGGVTFSQIIKNELINKKYPLLVRAASGIGSLQIRNKATITGNFVNNAPCADSVPPLLVYDARLLIQSKVDQREISLEEFLVKPYGTQLKEDEIVTKIVLPAPDDDWHGDFYKLGRRRAVSISRITLALLLKTDGDVIQEMRMASGAITPIGKRFKNIEKLAEGRQIGSDLFKELSTKLGEEIMDVTGLRWSSAYKVPVVQQLFYQLLKQVSQPSGEKI
ncbi:MAG: xanthine dehydrogenase family protein subunit M [Calditrichaceae bacterium]